MTNAITAPSTAAPSHAQGKAEKIRKDRTVNWWLTAVVAVLSLTVLIDRKSVV